MNVLTNSLKSLPNLIRNIVGFEGYVVRNYALKSDLKIKWVRPEKIPCWKPEKSGDLGLDLNVKPQDISGRFSNAPELKDADETVKKLFTLEYLPKYYTSIDKTNKLLATVRRHGLDRGSIESKLAAMTVSIHNMQEKMEVSPQDAKLKVRLKELIERRKKYLRYLRTWDYRRFEWILEKLNLVFKPPPTVYEPVWRKLSLRRLTRKHCKNIIQEKLDAYKAELESQHKSFYKEKAEKLAFIRKEELFCGLTPSVSEEEIENAKKKYESLE